MKCLPVIVFLFARVICYAQSDNENLLVPFQQYGLYGYKSKSTGAVVVAPQYDFADYLFTNGVTKVSRWKKAGLINKYGTEVVACKYDDIVWNAESKSYISNEGLVKVKLWGKYGLIDGKGKEVASCKFSEIDPFYDSIAIVKISGLSGCLDVNGREVIPCNFSDIARFKSYPSLIKVAKDGKFGVYNNSGILIVPCKYDEISLEKNRIATWLDEKEGMFDISGKLLLPNVYDTICDFLDSLALVKKSGKLGFVSLEGEEVVACVYDKVLWNEKKNKYFPGDRVTVQKEGRYGIIDNKGNLIVPCIYDWEFHLPVLSDFTEVSKNDFKGIINKEGKEILPCKYEEVTWDYDPLKNPEAPVNIKGKRLFNVKFEEKWGVVDESNNIVIPIKYEELEVFVSGIAAANLNGKWGYINMNDSVIVPFTYDYAQSFDKDLAIAGFYEFQENSGMPIYKFGLINRKGKNVLPFEYAIAYYKNENIYVFSDAESKVGVTDSSGKVFIKPEFSISTIWDSWKDYGMVKVIDKKESKYGYYNQNGKLVIPIKYTDAGNFSEGMVAMRDELKWGYFDTKGKEIIPVKYDEAYGFSEGLALVRLNAKYGYIDKKGRDIVIPQYVGASNFVDGYARVQENDATFGLIDNAGAMVIPAVQDNILLNSTTSSFFTEGLALAQQNGMFGYFDKLGTLIVPFQFPWADFFSANRALVKDTSGSYRFIRKDGSYAFPSKFSKAYSFYNGTAVVKTSKNYQMIDTSGAVIKNFLYEDVKTFYDGPAAVRLGKLWGFIDEKGNEILPPQYEKASSFRNGEAQVEIEGIIYRINAKGEVIGQGVK